MKVCLKTQRSNFNKRNWFDKNIHGSEVNNVYPVASFNDSKTDTVLKTVFALKDKMKKKIKVHKTGIESGALRLLAAGHFYYSPVTHLRWGFYIQYSICYWINVMHVGFFSWKDFDFY